MALLKHGYLQQNDWTFVGDEEVLPDRGKIVVSVPRWLKERDTLALRIDEVGVRLKNDASPLSLAQDLSSLKLIEVEFPKFTDGRAYSQARQLRDQLGYRGELRAVGAVLRDQFMFMNRCGIDSVVLPDDKSADGYLAALREFSVWYQPASDKRVPIFRLRHQGSDRRLGGAAIVAANVAAQAV